MNTHLNLCNDSIHDGIRASRRVRSVHKRYDQVVCLGIVRKAHIRRRGVCRASRVGMVDTDEILTGLPYLFHHTELLLRVNKIKAWTRLHVRHGVDGFHPAVPPCENPARLVRIRAIAVSIYFLKVILMKDQHADIIPGVPSRILHQRLAPETGTAIIIAASQQGRQNRRRYTPQPAVLMAHHTELLIVYQLRYGRIITTNRTLMVTRHLHGTKMHVQGVP